MERGDSACTEKQNTSWQRRTPTHCTLKTEQNERIISRKRLNAVCVFVCDLDDGNYNICVE